MFFIARGGGNFLSQNGFYFDIKHGHAILYIIFEVVSDVCSLTTPKPLGLSQKKNL